MEFTVLELVLYFAGFAFFGVNRFTIHGRRVAPITKMLMVIAWPVTAVIFALVHAFVSPR